MTRRESEDALFSPEFRCSLSVSISLRKSRDYDAENFLPSYRGLLVILLQAHREFNVTPKTLAEFTGNVLVLVWRSILSATENETLKRFNKQGGRLVITGQDI